jgi:hypothetical protein
MNLINSDGVQVQRGGYSPFGSSSQYSFYCGRRLNQCRCGRCDGRCGPTNGCPCNSCLEFSIEYNRKLFQMMISQSTYQFEIVVSDHPHPLVPLGPRNSGWACDGYRSPGGCLSGCTGFNQTTGWNNYRCSRCDFDFCDLCVIGKIRAIYIKNANGRYVFPGLLPIGTSHESAGDLLNITVPEVVYCAERRNECRCGGCDGQCGPSSGCPCNACRDVTLFLRHLRGHKLREPSFDSFLGIIQVRTVAAK